MFLWSYVLLTSTWWCARAFTPAVRGSLPRLRRGEGCVGCGKSGLVQRGGVVVQAKRSSAVDEFVGEATGTALLLTIGFGVAASETLDGGVWDPFGLACIWGVGATFGILASSDLSGAHLNPAVTLALAAFRKFPLRKVPRYVAAQCLGSVVASALTAFSWRGVASGPVLDAFPFIMRFSPGVSVPAGAFVEMWQTAVLAYAIFTLTGPRHAASVPKGSPPFIIGGVLAALITLGGPLTGAGFNPARDLGPRVVAALAGAGKLAFPTGWWAYTVGPVLGGLAGAAFAVTVTKSEEAVALTQFPNPDISPEDTAL